MLEPAVAVLDEIDSGLDIDRLQDVSKGINALRDEQGTGVLQITHYQRILDYVEPDHVHVMLDGEVVKSGGAELAEKLEDKGVRLGPRGRVRGRVTESSHAIHVNTRIRNKIL